jgi:PAS domain S-box-containing protein
MAFIFYFYKIYQRMQELSIELKEQVAHRKIQADLLRKKSAEFRSFVENSPDVIIRYDCEGRRIYVNPSAEKLFGLPANEIVGKTPLDGSPNPSDVMFMEKLQTVIQTKIPFEFESEFTTSTGEKRWENYRIFPEFDLNRNIISVLSIGRDITEHKKNEDLFNLKQSRLAQMGEMISMIAHQWRQPLGAISTTAGSIELKIDLQTFDLETKEGRDKQNLYFKERLKKIRGFVEILTTTIDDFRSFYNYNSHEEMEMHDSEMMQVILNIFKNAQDNFKEKQIKNPIITITTFEKTLSICDNGSGIPNEIIEKIFDPYFSTKSEKNGTGLGLYMSKIIIEEHHKGTLDAINVDDGVCFKINLTKEK